jgi:gamma-D-glutamyl-L-lysine dipeptidyl-peptidase
LRLRKSQGHALVRVGLLPVLRRPDHRAERVTEAPLGTPLRVLSAGDADWWRVRLPDGYEGFARSLGLSPCGAARARRFASAPRLLDLAAELRAETGGLKILASCGSRLPLLGRTARVKRLELPEGGPARARGRWGTPPRRFLPASMARIARSFVGVPYAWGGRSGWGLDCSGLVQLSAELAGLALPRDARDQIESGRPVGADEAEPLAPGDLLFFGHSRRAIHHVAVYLAAGRYVHAFGWVRINSLRPHDTDYLPELLPWFRGARRLA